MTSPRATATTEVPPLQVALIAFLGLVFLFCVVRTISALRGKVALPSARPAVAVVPSPTPTPAFDEPSPDPTETPQGALTVEEVENSGAALIAGELPPEFGEGADSDTVLEEPVPTATPKPRPARPVAQATPSPTTVDVEAPPAVPPEAAPPPPPPPTAVTLRGRVSAPAPRGVGPLRNHPLFLLSLRDSQMQEATTDPEGRYVFDNLEPGGFYYVIALVDVEMEMGTHVEYQAGGGMGGIGWGSQEVPTLTRTQMSWHQAVEAPNAPGSYGLELDPSNADPEFCGDVRPTYDPVTRTPFRSWRRSMMQPL